MEKSFLIECLFAVMIVLSYLFDSFSIYVKTKNTNKRAEYFAYSNLIQYISRLINMVVVFLMAISFENYGHKIDIYFILFSSSIVGVILMLIGLRSKWPYSLASFLVYPVIFIAFNKIRSEDYWARFEREKFLIKNYVVAVFAYILILFGMFLPFVFAEIYPNMRMTSVYVGQILNFIATLTVLAYQEPSLMRMLDSNDNKLVRATLIYSRITAYVLVVLASGLIWQL